MPSSCATVPRCGTGSRVIPGFVQVIYRHRNGMPRRLGRSLEERKNFKKITSIQSSIFVKFNKIQHLFGWFLGLQNLQLPDYFAVENQQHIADHPEHKNFNAHNDKQHGKDSKGNVINSLQPFT